VQITKPTYLGSVNVTVEQFRKFIQSSGYRADAEKDGKGGWGVVLKTKDDENKSFEQRPQFTWRNWGIEQKDDYPVVNVTWNDAVEFCKWLSKKEGKTYRLPIESEWEYACRAGTTTSYYNGDDPERLVEVANIWDASAKQTFPWAANTIKGNDHYTFTCPVGHFKPNAFGLYDMHGNAMMWCFDGDGPYKCLPVQDPKEYGAGFPRLYRGGCWNS